MSSIYRKGRDGYFYYQTYTKNKVTGKMDNKIFHSLGTKDRSVAEQEKRKLDEKYQPKKETVKNKLLLLIEKNKKMFPIVIVSAALSSIITLTVGKVHKKNYRNQKINKLSENQQSNYNSNYDFETNNIKKNNFSNQINTDKKTESFSIAKQNSDSNQNTKSFDIDKKKQRFFIKKVEKISEIFNQVKITVSIVDKYTFNDMEIICREITESFSEYSNVIICVYDESMVKLDFEKEIDRFNQDEFGKSPWIAIYTYNDVEGAFLDYDPSEKERVK
tara:strand:+ start:123 stop:947 length:825 start_codon:yes stop_codon:yes gene_type:complete